MNEDATVEQLIAEGIDRLSAAGVTGARREARLLLACAGPATLEDQLTGRCDVVSPATAASFRTFAERRAQGEPLSRIRGSREFWSLEFALTAATLDPRPDSECLVETALRRLAQGHRSDLRILDLGTGSGCLLLSLLHELPAATGIGIDRSEEAVTVAAQNARQLGCADRASFVVADWTEAIAARFDVVVANPPYIPTADIAELPREVRVFDPTGALDGGPDGLDAYRQIATRLPNFLPPGGFAVVEVGRGMDRAVTAILTSAGLNCVDVVADLSGIKRCVVAISELGGPPKKGLD